MILLTQRLKAYQLKKEKLDNNEVTSVEDQEGEMGRLRSMAWSIPQWKYQAKEVSRMCQSVAEWLRKLLPYAKATKKKTSGKDGSVILVPIRQHQKMLKEQKEKEAEVERKGTINDDGTSKDTKDTDSKPPPRPVRKDEAKDDEEEEEEEEEATGAKTPPSASSGPPSQSPRKVKKKVKRKKKPKRPSNMDKEDSQDSSPPLKVHASKLISSEAKLKRRSRSLPGSPSPSRKAPGSKRKDSSKNGESVEPPSIHSSSDELDVVDLSVELMAELKRAEEAAQQAEELYEGYKMIKQELDMKIETLDSLLHHQKK